MRLLSVVGRWVAMFLMCAGVAMAKDPWLWVTPTTPVSSLTDIATLNDVHYITTHQGDVLSTPDGKAWSVAYDSDPLHRLNRIKVLRGHLYALGDRGRILRSTDGHTWTVVHESSRLSIQGIVDNGTDLVALAASGQLLRSKDGLTWQTVNTNLVQVRPSLSDIAFGQGVYVVANDSSHDPAIYRSLDGITWSSIRPPVAERNGYRDSLTRAEFADGKFVAVGGSSTLITSPDGIAWTLTNITVSGAGIAPKSVHYINQLWVVPGYNAVATSKDGMVWTSRGSVPLHGAAYAKGTYLGLGSSGNVHSSPNASTWSPTNWDRFSIGLIDVTYGLGKFHAGGVRGGTLTSVDGLAWAPIAGAPNTITCMYGDENVVISAGFGFVHVRREGSTLTNVLPQHPSEVWDSVQKWKGRYFVMGNNHLYCSSDAVNWVRIDTPKAGWLGVGAASDSMMLIPIGGQLLKSTDGVNFSLIPGVSNLGLSNLAYFKGEFFAIVSNYSISRSKDGLQWSAPQDLIWSVGGTAQTSLLGDVFEQSNSTNASLYGPLIVLDDQLYVSFGSGVLSSSDGRTWKLADLPSSAAATDGTRIVAVYGDGGIAIRRPSSTGELSNISVRTKLPTGDTPLIVGTVVKGGQKTVLARAAGRGLRDVGIVGTTSVNPSLALFHGSSPGGSNDDWDSGADTDALSTIMSQVGAFAWKRGSKEAALTAVLPNGATSTHVRDLAGPAGLGLAELYVIPNTIGDTGQIVNLSTRGTVEKDEGALIAGFAISGGNATVLIRGIGPGLLPFGVTDALPTTRLDVYRGDTLLAANDAWSVGATSREIEFYASETGAFALAQGSRDSSLLLTLPPGTYTAVLSSPSGQSGSGMIEVYLVNP